MLLTAVWKPVTFSSILVKSLDTVTAVPENVSAMPVTESVTDENTLLALSTACSIISINSLIIVHFLNFTPLASARALTFMSNTLRNEYFFALIMLRKAFCKSVPSFILLTIFRPSQCDWYSTMASFVFAKLFHHSQIRIT